MGTPRILNFYLLMRSVSKMLPSVKFAGDKVLVFLIVHKNANIVQLRV